MLNLKFSSTTFLPFVFFPLFQYLEALKMLVSYYLSLSANLTNIFLYVPTYTIFFNYLFSITWENGANQEPWNVLETSTWIGPFWTWLLLPLQIHLNPSNGALMQFTFLLYLSVTNSKAFKKYSVEIKIQYINKLIRSPYSQRYVYVSAIYV